MAIDLSRIGRAFGETYSKGLQDLANMQARIGAMQFQNQNALARLDYQAKITEAKEAEARRRMLPLSQAAATMFRRRLEGDLTDPDALESRAIENRRMFSRLAGVPGFTPGMAETLLKIRRPPSEWVGVKPGETKYLVEKGTGKPLGRTLRGPKKTLTLEARANIVSRAFKDVGTQMFARFKGPWGSFDFKGLGARDKIRFMEEYHKNVTDSLLRQGVVPTKAERKSFSRDPFAFFVGMVGRALKSPGETITTPPVRDKIGNITRAGKDIAISEFVNALPDLKKPDLPRLIAVRDYFRRIWDKNSPDYDDRIEKDDQNLVRTMIWFKIHDLETQ